MVHPAKNPFSLKNFVELYRNSAIAKSLGIMARREIDEALKTKNVVFLREIYDVFLDERQAEDKIMEEFIEEKDAIYDAFVDETKMINQKFAEKAENAEKEKAEALLQKIK